ncbi:hypothetical protein SEVIR_1G303500v4 [Setaria viridis]|uniref:Uncharacterized protein n=2 Tax=Setaria TaxID=4554 RepID=K3YZX8_SETIT|nr:transcription termination factor MTERF2, chloroplastic [Setaria italica]XP_034594597.1 transcription termination factor MTERF2, chloroplastic-like [Setaria viridis]RCV08081.1 hypothetical protein SETIT_1G297900v2 [Setaria italica]TKW41264.1 hypothetical protein SEVIR_1G303500v2 [Setaria viridis]
MLRLRSHLLSAGRAASPLPPDSLLNRLLHLSTATAPHAHFVPEEFLITTCGLTPVQALRSSRYLVHLKSPSNPEAVLAFFADIGLAKADIAAAISRDPRILCARVDKTLTPRLAQLRDIGLSRTQISRFIAVAPNALQSHIRIPRLAFYISLLGSYDKVHPVLKMNPHLLGHNVEREVKPNIAFLLKCGLTNDGIAKLFLLVPRMFMLKPEGIKGIVECAHKKLGVPCNSAMFKFALATTYSINPQRVGAKLDFLMKALGCSETELRIAVGKMPTTLKLSEVNLTRTVAFLKMEVGLEAKYIVHRPAVLSHSMERRMMPRHYVLKVLRAKGLVKDDIDFYNVVCSTEQKFAVRFIERYKEIVPMLPVHYAAACAGQLPPEI